MKTALKGTVLVLAMIGVFSVLDFFVDVLQRDKREASIQYSIEKLEELWEAGEIERIDCTKFGTEKYNRNYADLIAVHASMCASASEITSAPGQDWFFPEPPGFRLVEE